MPTLAQEQAAWGKAFVEKLRTYLGDPYVYGAAGPDRFDCSGLVQYGAEQLGVKDVPRTSEEQWGWVQKINRSQLQPGDLIFSQWPGDNASPGHVQIYAGGGQVIQAPHTGANVSLAPLSQDTGHIVGYGRIPANAGARVVTGPGPVTDGKGSGPDISGLLGEAGTLLHGAASALDFTFGFFAPGQGWRIAFAAAAVLSGYAAVRAYLASEGSLGGASFPLAVGLAGVAAVSAFMAARPWPQQAGGSERPGEYLAEILEGQPPPPGPKRVSETPAIEAGLGVILAAWLASKASGTISSIIGAVTGFLTALGAGFASSGGEVVP